MFSLQLHITFSGYRRPKQLKSALHLSNYLPRWGLKLSKIRVKDQTNYSWSKPTPNCFISSAIGKKTLLRLAGTIFDS